MSNYAEAGQYRVQIAWKPHKDGYEFRKLRKKANGRWNHYGVLRRYREPTVPPTYRVEYWADRDFDEVYHEHKGWALDDSTLRLLKSYFPVAIGVQVKQTGETYRTPWSTIEPFITIGDHATAVVVALSHGVHFIDWSKRIGRKSQLGARQWVIPLSKWQHFAVQPKPQTILDAMRLTKKRSRSALRTLPPLTVE